MSDRGSATTLPLPRPFFVSPRYRCPACAARLWVEDIGPGEPGWRCRGCETDQTEHVLSVAPKRRPLED